MKMSGVALLAFTLILINNIQPTHCARSGLIGTSYEKSEKIDLLVNALSSPNTVLPFDYYTESFGFCRPEGKPKREKSSLGSVIFGDRLFYSTYEINVLENKKCQRLCETPASNLTNNFLIERIQEDYYHYWFIDSLPAARNVSEKEGGETFKSIGFPLGFPDSKQKIPKFSRPLLFNHHKITIGYRINTDSTYSIVEVIVKPLNIKHSTDAKGELLCSNEQFALVHDKAVPITYSYDVEWVENNSIEWGSRWDNYKHTYLPKVHWLSLIESFVIVIFLAFMVITILLRALHKDIARYNAEAQEQSQEEYGWKLIHADVFRTPKNPSLLSVLVGNGVQLFFMSIVILTLALLGLVSPSTRGLVSNTAIAFYVIFSFTSGYASSRIYKMMGGESWKRNFLMTAFLIPGFLSLTLVTLNFFFIGADSSAAIPFGALIGFLAILFLISAPLSFVGSYLGLKRPKIEYPTRINEIARTVPYQTFYLRRFPSILLGGIFPFSSIFIELFFIMNSIWLNRIYLVFLFLFFAFLLLCITSALSSILMCYYHLCSEDHRWWWRSFFTSGASALYAFLFGVFYFFYFLEISDAVSGILYFGMTATMCFLLFILTGTIGFLSCLWFVKKIYSAIRVD